MHQWFCDRSKSFLSYCVPFYSADSWKIGLTHNNIIIRVVVDIGLLHVLLSVYWIILSVMRVKTFPVIPTHSYASLSMNKSESVYFAYKNLCLVLRKYRPKREFLFRVASFSRGGNDTKTWLICTRAKYYFFERL